MMKRKLILLILVFSLVLVGCGPQDSTKAITQNFKLGYNSVDLTLQPNTPPKNLYQKSDFKIIAKVENKAAYDLNNVKVTLVGIVPHYFDIFQKTIPLGTLVGRSVTNPQGDIRYVDFDGTTKELFLNSEKFDNVYFIRTSFDSNLEFSDVVCLNTQLFEMDSGGCTLTPRKSYKGQGAPVGVVSSETIISPGLSPSAEFRLKIQNKGRGKAKTVTFKNAKLGNDVLTCEFEGALGNKLTFDFSKSKKKEALLKCKTLIADGASYATSLLANFVYTYEYSYKTKLMLMK